MRKENVNIVSETESKNIYSDRFNKTNLTK